MKLIFAGLPLTPVPRIAGAVFRAATDPDVATSGCPWVLPDDGPVIRVEKEALRAGVYKSSTCVFAASVGTFNLGRVLFPGTLTVMAWGYIQLCESCKGLGSVGPRLGTYFPPCAVDRCSSAVLLAVTFSKTLFF